MLDKLKLHKEYDLFQHAFQAGYEIYAWTFGDDEPQGRNEQDI